VSKKKRSKGAEVPEVPEEDLDNFEFAPPKPAIYIGDDDELPPKRAVGRPKVMPPDAKEGDTHPHRVKTRIDPKDAPAVFRSNDILMPMVEKGGNILGFKTVSEWSARTGLSRADASAACHLLASMGLGIMKKIPGHPYRFRWSVANIAAVLRKEAKVFAPCGERGGGARCKKGNPATAYNMTLRLSDDQEQTLFDAFNDGKPIEPSVVRDIIRSLVFEVITTLQKGLDSPPQK
jgi:hypothetical protein